MFSVECVDGLIQPPAAWPTADNCKVRDRRMGLAFNGSVI